MECQRKGSEKAMERHWKGSGSSKKGSEWKVMERHDAQGVRVQRLGERSVDHCTDRNGRCSTTCKGISLRHNGIGSARKGRAYSAPHGTTGDRGRMCS